MWRYQRPCVVDRCSPGVRREPRYRHTFLMRASLKATAELLLTRGGVATFARALHRRDAMVLAYHNVRPDDVPPLGDRSLHLSRADFAEQLDLVAETHDVVPLDSLRTPDLTARKRPRVAITFDDAYAGALTVGVEELAKRAMPATFFVAPHFLGGRSFWWDAFAEADDGLPVEVREHSLGRLCGRDDAVRQWIRESGRREVSLPVAARCGTVDELRSAVASGMTVASHSWSHANLASLSEADVRDELERSQRWLTDNIGATVPWIAYPYGLASPMVERVAASLGFHAGLLTEGGWVRSRRGDEFSLARLTIPAGVTEAGFVLRAAGVV